VARKLLIDDGAQQFLKGVNTAPVRQSAAAYLLDDPAKVGVGPAQGAYGHGVGCCS